MSSQKDKKKALLEDDISRVSNCVTWFLKQFEAEKIEGMEIDNLVTKIEEGSSSMLAILATI